MIKVTDLSKNYDTVEAVKSISFDLNDGEIIGFLGANGAGKTTTLKMITGYLVPTKGEIKINDLDIHEDTHEIQKLIGYLPELNPLYPEMRVYEYLEFLASIRNIFGRDFKDALARVVEQCGLRGVVHKNISDCSKGYKQRIGLAAAMIHDPKILILDEPVTGLDPNQIVEIRQLIKSLGKEKLVFMSSHILQEIERITEQIIILHQGRLLALGNLHSIRERLDKIPHRISIQTEDPKALAKNVIDIDEVFGISFPDGKNLSIQTHNLGAIHSRLPQIIVDNNHKVNTIDNPDDDLASILGYLTSGGGI